MPIGCHNVKCMYRSVSQTTDANRTVCVVSYLTSGIIKQYTAIYIKLIGTVMCRDFVKLFLMLSLNFIHI